MVNIEMHFTRLKNEVKQRSRLVSYIEIYKLDTCGYGIRYK